MAHQVSGTLECARHGVRANKNDANIGGHLATYASLATLVEVAIPFLPRLVPRTRQPAKWPATLFISGPRLSRRFTLARLSKAG